MREYKLIKDKGLKKVQEFFLYFFIYAKATSQIEMFVFSCIYSNKIDS